MTGTPSPRALAAAAEAQRPDAPSPPAAQDPLDRMTRAFAAAIRAEGPGHGQEALAALVATILRLARSSPNPSATIAEARAHLDLGAAIFEGGDDE